MNDRAAVFMAAIHFHWLIAFAARFHLLKLIDDGIAAAEILVDRHVVLRDRFFPMRNEMRAVFGVVL